MILLNKNEAKDMVKRLGTSQIFHTWGKYKHYYMVESPRNLKALDDYRNGRMSFSSDGEDGKSRLVDNMIDRMNNRIVEEY